MLSCPARDRVRALTLERLAATDWDSHTVVVLDDGLADRPQERQTRAALRLLETAAYDRVAFVLFLEDDLDFSRHLRHNLEHWQPLRVADPDGHFLASLYDPGVAAKAWDAGSAFSVAHPELVYGSQALLASRGTVERVLAGWGTVPGMQDIKISRLAAAEGPILYHRPSLVQHADVSSTWGGPDHRARDFDSTWKAPPLLAA